MVSYIIGAPAYMSTLPVFAPAVNWLFTFARYEGCGAGGGGGVGDGGVKGQRQTSGISDADKNKVCKVSEEF